MRINNRDQVLEQPYQNRAAIVVDYYEKINFKSINNYFRG
jgi:hypothetical protein